MAATCGAMFAKILLVIFNIAFLIAGIVLIAVGGWLLGDKNITTPFETVGDVYGASFLNKAAIILIFIGVFVVLATIFGIVAVIKEHPVLLSIYIAFLVIVCILEIAGGVVAIVFKDRMLEVIESGMKTTLKRLRDYTQGKYYYTSKDNDTCSSLNEAAPWDFFQANGKCCGLNGPSDYRDDFNFNIKLSTDCGINGTANVPWSCCGFKAGVNIGVMPKKTDVDCVKGFYVDGCYSKLYYNVLLYAPVLIGIGLGFGFLELFGIIFAVCVCQNPSKDRY